MLQFKSANGSRASRRWAKSGKAEHISKEMSSLKVYRASVGRRSASSVIPAQKQYLTTAGFLMEAFTFPILWLDCNNLESQASDIT